MPTPPDHFKIDVNTSIFTLHLNSRARQSLWLLCSSFFEIHAEGVSPLIGGAGWRSDNSSDSIAFAPQPRGNAWSEIHAVEIRLHQYSFFFHFGNDLVLRCSSVDGLVNWVYICVRIFSSHCQQCLLTPPGQWCLLNFEIIIAIGGRFSIGTDISVLTLSFFLLHLLRPKDSPNLSGPVVHKVFLRFFLYQRPSIFQSMWNAWNWKHQTRIHDL
jgi:hypothetical protein